MNYVPLMKHSHDTVSGAPALTRGLAVLRHLAAHGPLPLEALARDTGYPKASLLRLLDALAAEGMVCRDAARRFRATVALVPLAGGAGLDEQLTALLPRLAAQTGMTAEWYVRGTDGMVLVRRATVPGSEVQIRAQIGFVRVWHGELDAVAALGLACFSPPPAPAGARYNFFTRDGQRAWLTKAAAAAKVAAARTGGACVDTVLNDNGVRRLAAVVRRDGTPAGILALAEYARPDRRHDNPGALAALTGAARELGGGMAPPHAPQSNHDRNRSRSTAIDRGRYPAPHTLKPET